MKIEVTKSDMQSGKRNNAKECPVALAINRATGCQSMVYARYVLLNLRGKPSDVEHEQEVVVSCPDQVATFIDLYDRNMLDDVDYASGTVFVFDLKLKSVQSDDGLLTEDEIARLPITYDNIDQF
jgi:hypothetical protein